MADSNTKESSSVAKDDDIDAIPENSLPHFPDLEQQMIKQ